MKISKKTKGENKFRFFINRINFVTHTQIVFFSRSNSTNSLTNAPRNASTAAVIAIGTI